MGDGKDFHFPLIWVQGGTVVKELAIDGLHRRECINPIDTVHVGENAVVERMSVDHFSLENHTEQPCAKFVNRGHIKLLCSDSLTAEDIENQKNGRIECFRSTAQ